MHEVALDLLILLGGIWLVAVTLRPLGLPTVMGELIVGVLLGPAVFGWIQPSEAITLLAEIGIFFLMFHAGVETQPSEFFDALKRSMGVAVVGAIVPFSVSFGVATLFGLDRVGAVFVGLIMTATAVVITLKSLKDLGLANTRLARIIVASCVIDDLLTLVVFSIVIGVLSGGSFEPASVAITLLKVLAFFAVSVVLGRVIYPRLTLPFRSEGGKGFTFILFVAFAAGLFAEAIGLHMILGAYLAGLFFEDDVAHPNLVRVVHDRAYGIAYSFLGPIFFISLGFSVTFDIDGRQIAFLVLLTSVVIVGQIVSAGSMALRIGLPPREALTVGVGMCGRAEMAFILAALALSQAAIDRGTFSVVIFTAFVLNLFTPLALKGCAVMLEGKAVHTNEATRGLLQIDKFHQPLLEAQADGRLPRELPDVKDAVVILGYGPEVEVLLAELESRGVQCVVVEDEEKGARELHERGLDVVHAVRRSGSTVALKGLSEARAIVANRNDERDALLAMGLRERGFAGPIVAMITNPQRRAPMTLAGATAAFTPNHVLAAVIARRASASIGPRVAGAAALLGSRLEVAEVRVHNQSPLAHSSLATLDLRRRTGAHIVGRWANNELEVAPPADEELVPGTILVAAGSSESIEQLGQLARPITHDGRIVVLGDGDVAQKVAQILRDAAEDVWLVSEDPDAGVDQVGDPLDHEVLRAAQVASARAVILALEGDSATILAAKVLRDFAPEVPIIASVTHLDNVAQAEHAGADFALSVSQISGQILVSQLLSETMSVQPRIRLVKRRPGPLDGKTLLRAQIRERTGCSVVAVDRGGEMRTEVPPDYMLSDTDALYLCGTARAIARFDEEFGTEA